nr:hypothetical protein [Candidatus Sigynarchaeota archaeon]
MKKTSVIQIVLLVGVLGFSSWYGWFGGYESIGTFLPRAYVDALLVVALGVIVLRSRSRIG